MPQGFLKHPPAQAADAAAGAGAGARLARGLRAVPGERPARPGHTLHGLRHPVLQPRLPARQPHPRLERPRLPGPLAGGDRAAARHQQLPRVHRPAVPGALRGRLRARHQPAAVTIKQVEVSIIERAFDEGWVGPAAAGGAHRASGSRSSGQRPVGARRRPAADPGRPRRRRLRAGRPHRRAAALRHPRVQDGEAASSTAASTRCGRRAPSSAPTPTSAANVPVERARGLRRGRAGRRRHRSGATCPSPAASSAGSYQAMEYLPPSNRVQEGDRGRRVPITAEGKPCRHHRRRRHRRRLPGHRPPAGSGVGPPVRDHAPAARGPDGGSTRGRPTQ